MRCHESKLARRVQEFLRGYHERQMRRVATRQLYLTNTRGALPVNSPILLGTVPIFLPTRRESPTFETPRTHAAHVEIHL